MSNYHRWIDRLQVIERKIRPSSVYLFFLILVAFFAGVLTWDLWSSQYPIQPAQSKNSTELSQALTKQAEMLASRNLELALAQEANDNMQKMFLTQHQKQKELERELAFYRSIMAPENQADGVAIHDLGLNPGLLPNQFRVKLVLTQLQKRKQALKGKAELTFIGLQDDKVVSLPLSSLTDDKLNFSFRYFQILETVVQFPEGFVLSQVDAKVTVPASRWSKGDSAELVFAAADLLQVEPTVDGVDEEVTIEDDVPEETEQHEDDTQNRNEAIDPLAQ